MRRPVERAEEGARSDDGVAASQLAAAHAGGGEAADPEDARRGAQDVQSAGVGASAGARGAAARTQ